MYNYKDNDGYKAYGAVVIWVGLRTGVVSALIDLNRMMENLK